MRHIITKLFLLPLLIDSTVYYYYNYYYKFFYLSTRCPVYHNLPRDCTLVAQPGQCCLAPVCNFAPTVDSQKSNGHGKTQDGIGELDMQLLCE